jgi:hypothetical protein
MVSAISQSFHSGETTAAELYEQVRARTLEIVAPLEIEDYVIQTAEFMSPPRWHIGQSLLRRISLLLQFLLRRVWGAHRAAQARHAFTSNCRRNQTVSLTH